MRVEIVYFTGCPNVDPIRELVTRCLAQIGRRCDVVEVNTDTTVDAERYRRFASPTILVDGVDILGGSAVGAASCRLRMPTEEELLSALGGHHEED